MYTHPHLSRKPAQWKSKFVTLSLLICLGFGKIFVCVPFLQEQIFQNETLAHEIFVFFGKLTKKEHIQTSEGPSYTKPESKQDF